MHNNPIEHNSTRDGLAGVTPPEDTAASCHFNFSQSDCLPLYMRLKPLHKNHTDSLS
jgi:hypothetical protein